MTARAPRKPRPPLDREGLERLALFYAGRYATTRSKLAAYLSRKLRERGWQGEGEPPVPSIVERFSALGYVDDRAFAAARSHALLRRGYGERRIRDALRRSGIAEDDVPVPEGDADEEALAAAHRFARRKRLGPYAAATPDPKGAQKAVAAMLRAGHRFDHVRRVLGTAAADIPADDG